MSEDRRSPPLQGREQLTELAVATMTALQDAELDEEMDLLWCRVFARSADILFDTVQSSEGVWQLQFKPMVELLLVHVRALAKSSMDAAARRREIRWAIDMAGF